MATRKTRRTVIGVCAGLILLAGIATTTAVTLTLNNNIKIDLDQDKINKLLDFKLSNIQKIIDNKKAERFDDIESDLQKQLFDVIGSGVNSLKIEITDKKPENSNNLKDNTYLKLSFKDGKTGQFIIDKNVSAKDENGKDLIFLDDTGFYIWLSETVNQQPETSLQYWTNYKINVSKEAIKVLNDEIIKSGRYDLKGMETVIKNDSVMDKFYKEITVTVNDESNAVVDSFKDIINNSLVSSSVTFNPQNGSITFNLKGSPKTKPNNPIISQIERNKFTLVDNVQSFAIENNQLKVLNLRFFTTTEIDVKTDIQTEVQKIIDGTNEYSLTDFTNLVNDNNKNDSLKELLVKKLSGIQKDNIEKLEIINDDLQITLKNNEYNNYNIKNINLPDNVELMNSNEALQQAPIFKITDLHYWTTVNCSIKSELFGTIKKIISDERTTFDEFSLKINTKKAEIIKQIDGIDNVNDINITANKQTENLEIKLRDISGSRPKYNLTWDEKDTNFEVLNNNSSSPTITVKNLDYYDAYVIGNAENAINDLKSFILDSPQKYTLEEFKDQKNVDVWSTRFLNNLTISESNVKLNNFVTSKTWRNNILEIQLDSNLKKYSFDSNLTGALTFDEVNSKILINASSFQFYEINHVRIELDLKDKLQNLIQESDKQYTKQEFEDNENIVKQKLVENIALVSANTASNINVNNIESYTVTLNPGQNPLRLGKAEFIINLPEQIDEKFAKYNFEGLVSGVIEQEHITGNKYKITVNGLKFYRTSGSIPMSEQELLALRQKVNEQVNNLNLVVATDKKDDEWYQDANKKKTKIIDTIKTYPITIDGITKTLGDFIPEGTENTNITRELSCIKIVLETYKEKDPIDGELTKIEENRCYDQGYVEVLPGNVIMLNWLDMSNPLSYFSISNGVQLNNVTYKYEKNLIIPKTINKISNGFLLRETSANIVIFPDSIISFPNWKKREAISSNNQAISFIKLPKFLKEIPYLDAFWNSYNLQTVYMYNDLTSIGEGAFVGTRIARDNVLTIPMNVKTLFSTAYQNVFDQNGKHINEIITWATEMSRNRTGMADDSPISHNYELKTVRFKAKEIDFSTWGWNAWEQVYTYAVEIILETPELVNKFKEVFSRKTFKNVRVTESPDTGNKTGCPVHGYHINK